MSKMIGRIEVLPDPSSLADHVAEWMTAAALAAARLLPCARSPVARPPKTLYGLLASDEFRGRFPWQRVSWYWGDERFVPHDHPESNYRMTREAMLAEAPVPPENIHPRACVTARPTRPPCGYEHTLQAAQYRAMVLDPCGGRCSTSPCSGLVPMATPRRYYRANRCSKSEGVG